MSLWDWRLPMGGVRRSGTKTPHESVTIVCCSTIVLKGQLHHSPGPDKASFASHVAALGSWRAAFLGRAIDPVFQRLVTETETRRGWFRPRPTALARVPPALADGTPPKLPQGSTNAREIRICLAWAEIGWHLRCWLGFRKA